MNNTIPFHSATHAPQITVDVNILTMLKQAASCLTEAAGRDVYLAAIGPDMELTIIVEEDAPSILPCFDEDDALISVKGAPLFISYNPAQVLKLAGKQYLTGPVIFYRTDGSSYTARVEHLDDYHFDLGEYGNVYHICQFGEMMERNGSTAYPEIQTQDEQGAWELGGKGYLAVQSCDDGWDYTLYHSDFSVMDGGQLGAPELTIQEAREQILEAHHMEKGRRLLQDYDAVMDKVAEAEELSADHRPSTLEKLAALASDTSAPKSSARSAPEL